MDVRQQFESVAKGIDRDGVQELLNWLSGTDFYTAPASTKYHGNYKGGLALHSLNVYSNMKKMCKVYNMPYDDNSIALVSLFHDVCKVGCYKETTRNVKDESTGVWRKEPFYKFEEDFPFGGHGSKSVYLVQHFVPLQPDEAAAINSHMGAWDSSTYSNTSAVFENNPLAWALHVADEAATYINKT